MSFQSVLSDGREMCKYMHTSIFSLACATSQLTVWTLVRYETYTLKYKPIFVHEEDCVYNNIQSIVLVLSLEVAILSRMFQIVGRDHTNNAKSANIRCIIYDRQRPITFEK